jgi:hypothetical protein
LLQQMSCGADPARVLAMIHDLGKRVPHNRMGYVLSTPVWVPKSGQPYRVITPLYKFVTALGCDGRIMLVQPGDFVRGCKAVVHLLLHYGVCPNLGASDNSYKCVEVPLAGRHPGRIERNHGSPLSAAAVIRSPDVYQMLLHAGALPALWHVWGGVARVCSRGEHAQDPALAPLASVAWSADQAPVAPWVVYVGPVHSAMKRKRTTPTCIALSRWNAITHTHTKARLS